MALSSRPDGKMANPLRKIVTGGQTGVDRAALDVALELGFPCGGWSPRGRLAEDGRIPDRYPLVELPSAAYFIRTRRNVRDSDGTLILTLGPLMGGTRLTFASAVDMRRPCLVVDFGSGFDLEKELDRTIRWLEQRSIEVLNVAGPRASQQPDIARRTREFLGALLQSQMVEAELLATVCP